MGNPHSGKFLIRKAENSGTVAAVIVTTTQHKHCQYNPLLLIAFMWLILSFVCSFPTAEAQQQQHRRRLTMRQRQGLIYFLSPYDVI